MSSRVKILISKLKSEKEAGPMKIKNQKPKKIPYPNRIWTVRKKKGLGQKQLAYLMGLASAADISRYEHGLKAPGLVNLMRLEIALGVTAQVLYHDLRSEIFKDVNSRRSKLDRVRPLSNG